MLVRTITGLSAALLAIAAMVWLQTPLLLCLVTLFVVIASHEICHAVHMKNKAMIVVVMVVAGIIPPALTYWHQLPLRLQALDFPLLLGYFILLVVLMIAKYEKTRFSHILYALLASLAVPGSVATLVLSRDSIQEHTGALYEQNLAVWFLFFTLCSAWMVDVFAYFVGVKLGKHKLCPNISPKKTVEGAIGGLLGQVVMNVLFALMFNLAFLKNHQINLLTIALISLPLGMISMVGDLAASVLKRNYGVKDFGKIFPGHGGVMDRFDSLVFVAPVLFAVLQTDIALGLNLFFKAAA